MHLKVGEHWSLPFDTANDLLHEADFYSQHLSEFQGNIVPRHYDVFKGEKNGTGKFTVQFSSISLDCRGQVLRTDLGILWKTSTLVFQLPMLICYSV